MLGAHSCISLCQEVSVERGTTSRKGPYSWWSLNRQFRNEIVWIVLPKPISSARMQLLPLREGRREREGETEGEIVPKLHKALAVVKLLYHLFFSWSFFLKLSSFFMPLTFCSFSVSSVSQVLWMWAQFFHLIRYWISPGSLMET
ncbi:hypothetical protein EYF80_044758 [Liparis tanakae]|uniref:Uncharacterized protein n=1 Tax=Liparis tanakae TaxID=230148 RepID=A0A4Z2FXJ1_9TELE|nr:hypothetical protein EYF80_044758 [Liparis tanakae]